MMIEKCKPYEIYRTMCDVYREICSSYKMFTNGLNITLTHWAWVENTVHGVKTCWLSAKEKVVRVTDSKEGYGNSFLEPKRIYHYGILWKRCNCNPYFLLPASEAKPPKFSKWSFIYMYIYIYTRGSLNKFPDVFRMGTFIDSTYTHETPILFEVISSNCNALVVPFQQLLEDPMEVLLCERVNDLRHSLFHLLNCLITTASELRE